MSTNETSKVVGRNVKGHREALALSADDVATRLTDALGKRVQPYIVNRMEKGDRPISVDELRALARILDVWNLNSLFVEDDREARTLIDVKTTRARTHQAYLRGIEILKQFMLEREGLHIALSYAKEVGAPLTRYDREDFSEVGAEEFWSEAESEYLLESARGLDTEEVKKRLGDMLDEPAS